MRRIARDLALRLLVKAGVPPHPTQQCNYGAFARTQPTSQG